MITITFSILDFSGQETGNETKDKGKWNKRRQTWNMWWLPAYQESLQLGRRRTLPKKKKKLGNIFVQFLHVRPFKKNDTIIILDQTLHLSFLCHVKMGLHPASGAFMHCYWIHPFSLLLSHLQIVVVDRRSCKNQSKQWLKDNPSVLFFRYYV